MSRVEIKFSGLGGQGIILASTVLGHAAVLDGKYATETKSYGAEARGTDAWGDVIISDKPVSYPMTVKCDILLAMSQQALDKYVGVLKDEGLLIVDGDLVNRIPKGNYRVYRVSATRFADQKMGRKIVANMIMLGFLSELTGIVSRKSLEKAVEENVPREREYNIEALRLGFKEAKAYKGV